MDGSQTAALEDMGAAFGLEERQAQEHDHAGTESERVSNKLLGELVRRIGDDCAAALGR